MKTITLTGSYEIVESIARFIRRIHRVIGEFTSSRDGETVKRLYVR